MEIRKLLKNGLFSATLLGCGLLHGHYKFCPNCGHSLRPLYSPSRFSPPRSSHEKDNCPCREDFDAPRHYHHFKEWRQDRGPWVDHDCCFTTEDHPVCHHQSKKHQKHSKKAHSKKHLEAPLPESAPEAQING